ncbi:response regulator [Sphingobacterium sp. LRF_L2]|uniref:response regulator n=1 Tax=Sphingobacterium sp. LRF_L2 TaxID=3369421 RepID=UPI003F5D9EE7
MVYKNDVMVCDDNFAILHVIELILQSHDIEVRSCINSSTLITEITKECPKLLIIDLWMPKMSGDYIVRKLRNNPDFNDLIILCMSASLDGRDVATKSGADIFISKPFDMEDLINVVNNVMK